MAKRPNDKRQNGQKWAKNQDIRSDYIAWLEAEDTNPTVQAYFRKMEMLRLLLNTQLFMNVQELETHVALYPIGSRYQKHLDQFSHGSSLSHGSGNIQHRQLSAVLYLNQNWQAHHGGALKLYLDAENALDILPHAGRIVLFYLLNFGMKSYQQNVSASA